MRVINVNMAIIFFLLVGLSLGAAQVPAPHQVMVGDKIFDDRGGASHNRSLGDDYDKRSVEELYLENEHNRNAIDPIDKALFGIYVVITVLGLVANGVVFFVVFGRNEINKTLTAMYVVQLAVADSFFLFSLPMFGMQKITENWSFGQGMCTICQTLKFLNYYAGIFLLTAMSVDRCIAVTYGAKAYQLRTKKRTLIASCIVWLAAIVMSAPIAVFAKTNTFDGLVYCKLDFPGFQQFNESNRDILVYYYDPEIEDPLSEFYEPVNDSDYYFTENVLNDTDYFYPSSSYSCSHQSEGQGPHYNKWVVINSIIGFWLPFSIILLSYAFIVKKLRSTEARIASMTGKKTLASRKKVTRMVAALVIGFVVCWLPHHVLMLAMIQGFFSSVSTCVGLKQFLVALGFSNSAINPLLYTFLGNNFKDRFRDSVSHTRKKWGRSSLPSATGHHTKSHSDHKNNSFTRKFGKMVTFRPSRMSSASSNQEEKWGVSKSRQEKLVMRNQVPLVDQNKKTCNNSCSSDQNDHIDYTTSKCFSNLTEFSRLGLETRK